MITLLSKIFIKNRNDTSDVKVREKYGMLCGTVGIFLNALLSVAKIITGTLTGAISIVADGVNNVTDAGSSVITLFGFRLASKPTDPKHPFGHGRIEYISGLIVAVLIIVVGAELAVSSIETLINPEKIEINIAAMIILGVSVAVKLYMAFYNYAVAKKISSAAMKATGADSISDSVSTLAVLVCAIVAYFTDLSLDGYVGLLVSVFIIFSGIKSMIEIVNLLIGTAPDPALIKEIAEFVKQYPAVRGIHDLVVHSYGVGRTMITLHAEVDAKSNIMEAHDCIDNIEHDLAEKFRCSAVIHLDPVVTDDPKLNLIRDCSQNIVKSINPEFSIHDFRMNEGPTHPNVIFDLVLTHDAVKNEKEIVKIVSDGITNLDPSYRCVINVDIPYASDK